MEEAESLVPIGFFPPVVLTGEDESAQLNKLLQINVDYLRNSSAVQKCIVVSGWIYNVSTGTVVKTDFCGRGGGSCKRQGLISRRTSLRVLEQVVQSYYDLDLIIKLRKFRVPAVQFIV